MVRMKAVSFKEGKQFSGEGSDLLPVLAIGETWARFHEAWNMPKL